MQIRILPRKVLSMTLLIISVLLSAQLLGMLFTYFLGHDYIYGLIPLFDFDDELFQVHEALILPLREKFSLSGVFYFAWVIPYGIAAVLIAIAFLRFIVSLPRKTARLIVLSGATYVSGALGFEMLGGFAASSFGESAAIYAMAATIEELLEMIGIALFIYSLLSYMSTYMSSLQFEFQD